MLADDWDYVMGGQWAGTLLSPHPFLTSTSRVSNSLWVTPAKKKKKPVNLALPFSIV